MKRILFTICTVLGLVFSQLNAFAWGSAGHMVIAAEAFHQLSPELQAEVIEVLKTHPDYAAWVKAYHPNANVDLATYIVMRSSTWPDEIRRSGNIYDHPEWHFIDYPLRPPSFPMEPDARPTNNVVFGVGQCEQALSDTNAAAELRAAYMSYLIHLVGDMHQPLHCASYFTDVYTNGDRGGNDFYISLATTAQGQPIGVRLHGIWDGLLGNAVDPKTQWKYALKIDKKFPRESLPELTQHTTPKEWSLESRALAIQYGYLNGNLKGSSDADTAPPVPAGYTKAAKAVAEKQAALAGYRLADEIQQYLKMAPVAPLAPEFTNLVAQSVIKKKISTAEASNYYDEEMIVTGKVVEVSGRSGIMRINLDQPYPDTPLTAVIFDDNIGQFKDLNSLKNQNVEITGNITEYHDKPEIILETQDQIKVVK